MKFVHNLCKYVFLTTNLHKFMTERNVVGKTNSLQSKSRGFESPRVCVSVSVLSLTNNNKKKTQLNEILFIFI